MELFTVYRQMMDHLAASVDEYGETMLAIFLVLLAPASLFWKGLPSEVEGMRLLNAQVGRPTLADRILDMTLDITAIEKAGSIIKQNACEIKKKCKPASYQVMLKDFAGAINNLVWQRIHRIQDCRQSYGKSQKECADYSEDLHSAIHIVEDLNKTIKRVDNADGPVSSEENKVILKYLQKLTHHEKNMKRVLACLKSDSVKDKTHCDSLRPPHY
jgi:hypothetical protein